MQPLPSPNFIKSGETRQKQSSTNSAHARQNPTHWAAIYRPISTMLGLPTESARNTMRPSKSHLNLKDLPESMENLAVDRTANSTPAAHHKKDFSFGRSTILTPPTNKKIESTNLNKDNKQYLTHDDGNKYVQPQAEDDVFIGETRPAPESVPNAPVAVQGVLDYDANDTMAPQANELTPHNAQSLFPPSMTVFVANLSIHRTEAQLTKSVHEAFDQFGNCAVDIKKDRHRHPYAHVTYCTLENAHRALREGRELLIDDRKVRVEKGDCRREVILSRIGGGAVTAEEARALLTQYGPIEQIQPTTHADGRLHKIPEGMWVKFVFHGHYKKCIQSFNDPRQSDAAGVFMVSAPPALEPTFVPSMPSDTPIVQSGFRTPRSSTDQKSIFVGNLPEGTTEEELRGIFDAYGEIKGCNVIRKPITGGQGFNIFGFIEYATADEALNASEAQKEVRGHKIRVEPKEYSARRHTRTQGYDHPTSAERLPRGIAWRPSTNGWQQPGPPMPCLDFQPMYLQGLQNLPQLPFGFVWTATATATPPGSAHRQRGPTAGEFFMAGSPPQQFLPMQSVPFGMAPYRDSGVENPQPPPAQHY